VAELVGVPKNTSPSCVQKSDLWFHDGHHHTRRQHRDSQGQEHHSSVPSVLRAPMGPQNHQNNPQDAQQGRFKEARLSIFRKQGGKACAEHDGRQPTDLTPLESLIRSSEDAKRLQTRQRSRNQPQGFPILEPRFTRTRKHTGQHQSSHNSFTPIDGSGDDKKPKSKTNKARCHVRCQHHPNQRQRKQARQLDLGNARPRHFLSHH